MYIETNSTIISIIENIIVVVPGLLVVAYITVAERKTMASFQRRLGPNAVGYLGLLQAFADALKLILKEYVSPNQSNKILFFLGPICTLFFALVGFAVVPYAPGLSISDMEYGLLYLLAVSALSTLGILLAGWSANSKYAFLGSLRSTAQLISYELVLSSVLLIIIFITNSLNLNTHVQFQKIVWLGIPLFVFLIIFFIGALAETNRAPMDLAEAESEIVAGFMTEHAAVIFVFFFLAEYTSILIMCILTSILFFGGYLTGVPGLDLIYLYDTFNTLIAYIFDAEWVYSIQYLRLRELLMDTTTLGIWNSISLGVKSSMFVFLFIWIRASFPRIRFDQLMSFCWTILLPLLFANIIFILGLLYALDIYLVNLNLL